MLSCNIMFLATTMGTLSDFTEGKGTEQEYKKGQDKDGQPPKVHKERRRNKRERGKGKKERQTDN